MSGETQSEPARRRGLWLWFAAGFLIVFVTMSLSITMFVMHPSGQSVAEVKLWEYYLVEMSRFSVGPRTLGPATGTSSLFTVASQHVLISAAGGAVMMGIGWVIRRVRRRK